MLYDELDHIIINQALLVLKCIHKSFFTDPVDHTWDPGRCFMDLIRRFGCKDLLGTSGVIHMACDILLCLRSVQVWQGTVHINALADCGIPLQFQLVFSQFGLADQYNSHRTHGIKFVVEQKTEFFQCFLFKQMSFIKDADDLFVLHCFRSQPLHGISDQSRHLLLQGREGWSGLCQRQFLEYRQVCV